MKWGSIASVYIIGGGESIIHFECYLKNRDPDIDINVSAITVLRHEDPILPRTTHKLGHGICG